MPFNTPLPDQGTNPWYTPFKSAWDALVTFVNGLETRIDEIPPAVDPDWADVQNKPSTFPPATHTHAQGDVTGLAASLAGKASTGDLDNTFVVATEAQADATAALAGLETKLNVSAVAGLNTVGWGRVMYIANAAPDPTGLPDYTEVIRLPA